MNYDARLNKLRDELDKARNIKFRAEAKLEQLSQRESELKKEIEELGLKPENLQSEIEKLDSEIEKLFKEAESYMPRDIG